MNWNIFKRIAELESHVEALSMQLIQHGGAIADLQHGIQQPEASQPTVKIITASKQELKKAKQREYYWRNRDKLLANRDNEAYKQKQREYSARHKEKKLAQQQK